VQLPDQKVTSGRFDSASFSEIDPVHARVAAPSTAFTGLQTENRGLVALVFALANSPRTILQTLAETILDITQCDSAGLSLLTSDGKTPDVSGKRFYWPAIAGMWSPHVGGGTPRNFGPCGYVLDQNRTLRDSNCRLTTRVGVTCSAQAQSPQQE
jgi:hypothetical protein